MATLHHEHEFRVTHLEMMKGIKKCKSKDYYKYVTTTLAGVYTYIKTCVPFQVNLT
jgi:hypothetical protein